MGIKNILEKLTGIDKIKEQAVAEATEAIRIAREAKEAAEEAQRLQKEAEEAARLASLSPKERATEKGEPWVSVLDTHVNKDNIRNGFFELDWNEHFVLELRRQGYGLEGDPEEEIVDRWFRELCKNVAAEEGVDLSDRGLGFINVTKLVNGKAEVS
jgi:hypothetical protein